MTGCPCEDCPHEIDRDNNPCPLTTGEMEICDQYECKICNKQCGGSNDR